MHVGSVTCCHATPPQIFSKIYILLNVTYKWHYRSLKLFFFFKKPSVEYFGFFFQTQVFVYMCVRTVSPGAIGTHLNSRMPIIVFCTGHVQETRAATICNILKSSAHPNESPLVSISPQNLRLSAGRFSDQKLKNTSSNNCRYISTWLCLLGYHFC